MKKLKIIQTPARFYPYVGGVEKYVFGLSHELVKMGHIVKVICADEPKSQIKEVEGINILKLPYMGKIANTNITLSLPFFLLKEKFDIIHSYLPTPWSLDFSVFVAKLKRKKIVITYCNDLVGNTLFSSLVAIIYNYTLLKLNLLLVDRIIIIQPDYINYSKYLKGFINKIKFIPPGIDLKKFSKTSTIAKKNTIFFLSLLDSYHTYKGLDYLLEAISIVKEKIPTIKLTIGGKGELVNKYIDLSHKLKISKNVNFIGFIPDNIVQDIYNQSEIFILPSISHEEGFGIVLLEAMACKVPVISTSIVGIATEIKRNNCGIIVEPKDSYALAEAIIKILNSPISAKEMGENGRKLVEEKYSWLNISDMVAETYKELIK